MWGSISSYIQLRLTDEDTLNQKQGYKKGAFPLIQETSKMIDEVMKPISLQHKFHLTVHRQPSFKIC